MAYQRKEPKEHAFKLISKDVQEDKIDGVVLFYGREQYLVNWSVNIIINKYVNKATQSLDLAVIEAENATVDLIKENCETISMFSLKRVVVVSNFPPLWGGKLKGYQEQEENELIEYIKNVPENCILIFTTENIGRDKVSGREKKTKLCKAIEGAGKTYSFDTLDEKDFINFVAKRFKMSGKLCKKSVIQEIIKGSGYYHKETEYSLYNLENDLKKIIAHSDGEEIMLSDVLSTISGDLETYIFSLIDAVSRNRKDEAYRLLFNILNGGENVQKILSMFVSQFELILDVKELREEGGSLRTITDTLKMNEYRIKKALEFSERYQPSDIKEILHKAYDVDKNIKTGILEQNLAIEMFIAEI